MNNQKELDKMDFIKNIIIKIEKILTYHMNKKDTDDIENHLLLVSKPTPQYCMKKGRQFEPLNETHQLGYHFHENNNLKSYTYEDEEKITHVKQAIVSVLFPSIVNYRNYLTTILDSFWTPYNHSSSIKQLEEHMEKLFKELSIDIVIFDATTDSSILQIVSNKQETKELMDFVNIRLGIPIVFIANKEDGVLIDFEDFSLLSVNEKIA